MVQRGPVYPLPGTRRGDISPEYGMCHNQELLADTTVYVCLTHVTRVT